MTTPRAGALSAERPFPGLRPFDYSDHNFFFGRDEQFYALYRLIDRSRFTAVVGSSGSGKSSLVRAGLLPLLARENAEGGPRKRVWTDMRPGDAPIAHLGEILAGLSPDDDALSRSELKERVDFHLRRSSFGIAGALAELGDLGASELILIVDQFEELFRFGGRGSSAATGEARSRDEASQFVQLLLEVGRSRARNVHVLLTMRSDFIGDCAMFHGLPEAISASQFLVPSLTRDQLEEVIRGPVAKAGATIGPALVEHLLNDSANEPDQLPVLQHCLRRLWERAGIRLGPTSQDGVAEGRVNDPCPPPRRHLDSGQYEEIGRIAGALSQHADEILANLPGDDLAVEQAFRALAEIDKEGRAIRRALMFPQLLAETGVPREQLCRVLDRFRADDCSFLTPPLSDVAELAADTRIDVGHEALLRRWKRVSGDPDAKLDQSGTALIGWLEAERRDGERYHTLLATAESESAVTQPLAFVERNRDWWNKRPRTKAWAERYGGGFERVEKLFETSLAARQREEGRIQAEAKRQQRQRLRERIALGVMALFCAVTVGLLLMLNRERARTTGSITLALHQAHDIVELVRSDLQAGQVSIAAARSLLVGVKEDFSTLLRLLEERDDTPDIEELGVNYLLSISDISLLLGDTKESFDLASSAEQKAERLAANKPDDPRWQLLLFESIFRIGDYDGGQRKLDDALSEYRRAQVIAKRMASLAPKGPGWQARLIFIDGKVGETLMASRQASDGLWELRAALEIARKLAADEPEKPERQREIASTLDKIGRALAEPPIKDYTGALAQYDEALTILEKLERDSPNDIVLSNLANAHRGKADILRKQDTPAAAEAALAEYARATKIREKLRAKDPSNANWILALGLEYDRVGDLLSTMQRVKEARIAYEKVIDLRRELVSKDSTNSLWKSLLEASQNKFRDLPADAGADSGN
jgi:tetratricopeptide (TPR) repeat protein